MVVDLCTLLRFFLFVNWNMWYLLWEQDMIWFWELSLQFMCSWHHTLKWKRASTYRYPLLRFNCKDLLSFIILLSGEFPVNARHSLPSPSFGLCEWPDPTPSSSSSLLVSICKSRSFYWLFYSVSMIIWNSPVLSLELLLVSTVVGFYCLFPQLWLISSFRSLHSLFFCITPCLLYHLAWLPQDL